MIAREDLEVDDGTRQSQRRAADPRASAWVSANAGAGKTKVLTDRVVRLLLDGAPPGRVLCLTFTKAAAANMAIRVFDRLGRWVTLEEAALADELAELSGGRASREEMRLARRLFARAVETPGGLKIETLHAFCERLLHLVPFEANVPASFTLLDEAQAKAVLAEAVDGVLADAAGGRRPDLADAFALVGAEAAGDVMREAIRAASVERAAHTGRGGAAAVLARLRGTLGLGAGDTAGAVERRMAEDGLCPTTWHGLAERLRAESKAATERDIADALCAGAACEPGERLGHYLPIFFTDKGEPRKSICTKSTGDELRDLFLAEQARLEPLADRLRAVRVAERTQALLALGAEARRRVETVKGRQGALDFDDLVAKTLALLERGDGAWILYKLDRGIDHVLVDEAQDTNPEQWAILRRITEDFTAGHGARGDAPRTVFAVGDPKQSIFSFQGAAPHEFEGSLRHWRERTREAGGRFEEVRLDLSFRSGTAVLTAVDGTFAHPAHFKGLSFGDDTSTVHRTARPRAPGVVELWPVESSGEAPEPDAWTHPVDAVEQGSPPAVVARRVARAIRRWTTEGDEWGRVHRAGDIMVLVRKRGPAFEAAIRALRDARVPVAGQDRLDVAAHIAVMDLVAAGRTALLPADDLTLATALKTPLVDLDDDDLTRIAAGRSADEPLAAALRRHAEAGDPAARKGQAALERWRALARAHSPFGFYATLLGPGGGRAALVARLGGEAADAIDLFLSAARASETGPDAPSLLTFLARYEASGPEGSGHTVRRDLDAARNEVRVMTVHGAKGLEAPIVVVLDGCDVRERQPTLVPLILGDGRIPVWSRKAEDCRLVAEAREAVQARDREEANRLLYVAMTRAADRLVIAPFHTGRGDAPDKAWCEMVRRSLDAVNGGLVRRETDDGPVDLWGWREGAKTPPLATPRTEAGAKPPVWLFRSAPPEPEPPPPVRPSGALTAADDAPRGGGRPGDRHARLRGVLVHALLEHLPAVAAERRADAARAWLAARAPALVPADRERLAADALRVVDDPRLAPLFGPGSRAEAPIAGRAVIGGTDVPVSGRIDRLAVTEREVLVADFKTGAAPADGAAPQAYAAQLALYRALLSEIYPGRPVRAFLAWTAGPDIREVTPPELDAALAALGTPAGRAA